MKSGKQEKSVAVDDESLRKHDDEELAKCYIRCKIQMWLQ